MTNAPSKPPSSKFHGVSIARLAHAGLLTAGLAVGALQVPKLAPASAELSQVRAATIHAASMPIEPVVVVHRVKAPTVTARFALPPIFEVALEPVVEPALSAEMQRVRDWVTSSYRVSEEVIEPVLVQAEDSARKACAQGRRRSDIVGRDDGGRVEFQPACREPCRRAGFDGCR